MPDDPRKAKSIEKQAQEYRLDNGVLLYYTRSAWCIVVPKALQRDVIIECHSKPVAGHQGRTKTINRLKNNRLWWKGMSTDVRSFIRTCKTCQATKPVFHKPAGMMLSTHSSGPWEVVGVDLMGPLPKSYAGHEYLLVAVDHFSKWCEIFPIKKATGKNIACILVRQLFSRYGAPRCLLSDNGPQFISRAVEAVCSEWGVHQKFITPYHPQTNWVERVNRNIKGMLQAFTTNDHRAWDVHVSEFVFALNAADHESTGVAPSRIMLGRAICDRPYRIDWTAPPSTPPPLPGKNSNNRFDTAWTLHRKSELATTTRAVASLKFVWVTM